MSFQGFQFSGDTEPNSRQFPPVGTGQEQLLSDVSKAQEQLKDPSCGMGPKMTSAEIFAFDPQIGWKQAEISPCLKQWNQDAEKDLEQKNQELTASSQAHWGFWILDRACFMFFPMFF